LIIFKRRCWRGFICFLLSSDNDRKGLKPFSRDDASEVLFISFLRDDASEVLFISFLRDDAQEVLFLSIFKRECMRGFIFINFQEMMHKRIVAERRVSKRTLP
jgi:hypothetical protein